MNTEFGIHSVLYVLAACCFTLSCKEGEVGVGDECSECAYPDDALACFEGIGCVERCSAVCPLGHPCVKHQGEDVCDPYCRRDDCGPREDCLDELGDCQEVACSSRVACDGSAQICDEYQRDCFDEAGSCRDIRDCPVFDPDLEKLATRECKDGRCTLEPILLPAPFGVDLPVLRVQIPQEGDTLANDDELAFEWSPLDTTAIALVLDAPSRAQSDLLAHAVWGAVVPRGDGGRISWAEGRAIVNGEFWSSAGPPPVKSGLYFILQSVSTDELLASSAFVRFSIGGTAWPELGASCETEGEVGAECDRPGLAMACIDSRCRAVCLSQRDCDGLGTCAAPKNGMRVCR